MCLVNVGSHKKGSDGSFEFDSNGNPIVVWQPKLQIACATPVADGMIISTLDERSVSARNAVTEFILINHPLDCPICDEAGQCKLQEYAFIHSNRKSRFIEEKVHKSKRVEIGPRIMFDGERCIMCSRCIRFADEVAKQPALTFMKRGDKVVIETFPGMTFDSEYSMNVIDICPVGALTSMDFRFQARVWEMSFTDTVCPTCSRGCNISVGVMNNKVLRIEPRTNPGVNTYWMCDTARSTAISEVESNRVLEPAIRNAGEVTIVSWDEAVSSAADRLRGLHGNSVMVIGSGRTISEDNYALAKFANAVLKTGNVDLIKHNDHTFADDFLRMSDISPNTIGAHVAGVAPKAAAVNIDGLENQIRNGHINTVIIFQDSLEQHSQGLFEAVSDSDAFVIAIASQHSSTTQIANVILPLSSYAETEGTFVNAMHRVQHVVPAVETIDRQGRSGLKVSRWDAFGQRNDRWTKGLRRDCRAGWEIVRELASHLGHPWAWTSAGDVFSEMSHFHAEFSGMNYELLDSCLGVELGKSAKAHPTGVVYASHYFKPQ